MERGKKYTLNGMSHILEEIQGGLKMIKDLNINTTQLSNISVAYPVNWKPQTDNFLKVELFSSDSEYQKVKKNFNETLSNRTITNIYRL